MHFGFGGLGEVAVGFEGKFKQRQIFTGCLHNYCI